MSLTDAELREVYGYASEVLSGEKGLTLIMTYLTEIGYVSNDDDRASRFHEKAVRKAVTERILKTVKESLEEEF